MGKLSQGEFKEILGNRKLKERLILKEIEICDMDLTNWDLSNIDFALASFHRLKLDGANLEDSNFYNALFDECTLPGANFKNANLQNATLRYVDMSGCNIEGANFYSAVLENAKLDGVVFDKDTKWFKLYCPEKGAFLGYKKCFNDRLVQLLIPADAKRSSATLPTCRCNRAKVLSIKSFDYKENYKEASSLVDDDFIYRVGQWVEVKDFNEDRWRDSTTGIHFWMTREEAKNY